MNAAVMAKIHTVEWTLAILPHPTVRAAHAGNWYGLLGPRGSRLRCARVTRWDFLTGIPGSRRDDHGVPYSITEEFVAVYRMHPLLPDEFDAVRRAGGREIGRGRCSRCTGPARPRGGEELGRRGALVVLRRRPRRARSRCTTTRTALRGLMRGPRRRRGPSERIDLATIDIVRDRERGVPRYNDFRRMLRLAPAAGFEELTGGDAGDAPRSSRRLYGDDVERVDLMVGLYAEPLPKGFGFSETAFRIFVLMASRRLKSDPFFTDDYRPEVYTRRGDALDRGRDDGRRSSRATCPSSRPAGCAPCRDRPSRPGTTTARRRCTVSAPIHAITDGTRGARPRVPARGSTTA